MKSSFAAPGVLICNAMARGYGEQCKNPAVRGMTKCRNHGGKSLRGIASATYKHGRYSKYNLVPMEIFGRLNIRR